MQKKGILRVHYIVVQEIHLRYISSIKTSLNAKKKSNITPAEVNCDLLYPQTKKGNERKSCPTLRFKEYLVVARLFLVFF